MSVSLDIALMYDVLPVDKGDQDKHPDPRVDTDEHLVSRAQNGDSTAFDELVRRYRNDVFALAYHYLRDREEAWDTAQEVFLKAYRGLGRFRGEAKIKTWLLRITANRCKDHFKKRRLRTVALEDAAGAGERAASVQGPDAILEARELGATILAALDTLPDKHRSAFVLREFEGLSYGEMAGVMGCSSGTVMSRLHHARKKLQKALIRMGAVEDH